MARALIHPMHNHPFMPQVCHLVQCHPHPHPHLCLCLLHCPLPPAGSNSERSEAVAVGTWSMEAAIYSLPDLRPLFKEALPTDVIPRR